MAEKHMKTTEKAATSKAKGKAKAQAKEPAKKAKALKPKPKAVLPAAKKELKPKVQPKPKTVKVESREARPTLKEGRVPRVEVIKKVEVLKRKAEEEAREQAAREAMERQLAAQAAKEAPPEEPHRTEFRRETPPAPAKEKEAVEAPPPRPVQRDLPVSAPEPPKAHVPAPPPPKVSAPPPPKAPAPPPPAAKAPPPRVAPSEPAVTKKPKEMERPREEAPQKLPKRAPEPAQVGRALATAEAVAVEAPPASILGKVKVSFPVTLGELAPKLGKSPNELIKLLMQRGMMMTINQRLDEDSAKKIASDFGYELDVVDPLELEAREAEVEDPSKLKSRPPVVTVMGHVDHGKTSLLDAIRKTNVMASEEGGITQRIGAYQVELTGRKITFLDTPGHEAFTAMRARGTKVTDVAVLVVAADDGVMPQTMEAIDHARAANVPMVVAVNKIDKPNANVDRVMQQLTEHGLQPEEWGGSTVFVKISAKQKTGIEELLEMILLVADLAELKANPEKPARGTIIEAKLDRGKGPVATVLIQEGTFKSGDAFVAGSTYGKVRAFVNDRGERIPEAPPSSPVEIIGLNDVPEAGDTLQVVADEKVARSIAEARLLHTREQTLASLKRVTLDDLYQQIKEGEIKDLNLILKADGQGSVEALKDALERLTSDEVRVRVIHTGVGSITESDVMLASASNAIIIGFNIRPEPHIKNLAEREKVDLRFYRVIYQAIEDITQAMVGMRKPMYRETVVGRVEVLQTFKISKVGTIAGCRVTDGKITRDSEVRVLRDGAVAYEGKLASLKRFKDDAREVAAGFECGMGIERFNDVKVGDVIEAFVVEEVRHTTLAGKGESRTS